MANRVNPLIPCFDIKRDSNKTAFDNPALVNKTARKKLAEKLSLSLKNLDQDKFTSSQQLTRMAKFLARINFDPTNIDVLADMGLTYTQLAKTISTIIDPFNGDPQIFQYLYKKMHNLGIEGQLQGLVQSMGAYTGEYITRKELAKEYGIISSAFKSQDAQYRLRIKKDIIPKTHFRTQIFKGCLDAIVEE